MNKKGVFAFEVIILIIAVGLLIILFANQYAPPERLGERQFLIQRSLDSVQLELFDLEQRGKHAFYDSIEILARGGGFATDPTCSSVSVGDRSYSYWARRGSSLEDCRGDISLFTDVFSTELALRNVDSSRYDFYFDDTQFVGVASHFWQRTNPLVYGETILGQLQQYPKPSFRVRHSYDFQDYEKLQNMSSQLVQECASSEDEELVSCAENVAKNYESDFASIAFEKVAQSRILIVEAEQKYTNLFTGPIVIAFAIGLELRVNQESFSGTTARISDGTVEQSFSPDTVLNTRLPERIEIEIPFATYDSHRVHVSYSFDAEAELIDVFVYDDGTKRRVTQRDISDVTTFLTSRGSDDVTYFMQGSVESFFVPVPSEPKQLQLEAVYAGNDGTSYVQLIDIVFRASSEDISDSGNVLYQDGDIIALDPGFTELLLIESIVLNEFSESSNLGWIPAPAWSVSNDILMKDGEPFFLPEISYFVVDTATADDSFTVLYGVLDNVAIIDAVIVQPGHTGIHEFYTAAEFIDSSFFADWEFLKQEAQFDYDVRQSPP